MRKMFTSLPFLLLCAPGFAADLAAYEAGQIANLVEIYKGIHAHPELSHFEANTSAILAAELKKAGYSVTDHIGVYPDGAKAYGVVGILKNGPGPTLLIRADMDALPIVEETGVPYASHVTTKNAAGQEVGVMHACGHDIHTTVLIGTARALAAARADWHGTLMLVGQPSEETVDGARAMLADHLYERFGTPDMIIGLHDGNDGPAGTVEISGGPVQSGVTSYDVLIRGIGGHGAAPEKGRDPIVMAASFIMQLQTIVSREENPFTPTVVTVGSIHGGTRRNIIPDEVTLELTTRTFSDESSRIVAEGLRHIAEGVAIAAGLPADRAPVVTRIDKETSPVLINDPAQTDRVKAALVKELGADKVFPQSPVMPSEDVGAFGLEGQRIPLTYFFLNAMTPEKSAAATAAHQSLPGPHNSRFQPDPELTLAAGVRSLTAGALELLR